MDGHILRNKINLTNWKQFGLFYSCLHVFHKLYVIKSRNGSIPRKPTIHELHMGLESINESRVLINYASKFTDHRPGEVLLIPITLWRCQKGIYKSTRPLAEIKVCRGFRGDVTIDAESLLMTGSYQLSRKRKLEYLWCLCWKRKLVYDRASWPCLYSRDVLASLLDYCRGSFFMMFHTIDKLANLIVDNTREMPREHPSICVIMKMWNVKDTYDVAFI